jgi:hypothetical protein
VNEPFLQIEKSFFSSPFWKEKREYSRAEAWIDIKDSVHYSDEPGEFLIGNKTIPCAKNECLFSLETWATRWGWKSKHKVKTFLELLQKREWIKLTNEKNTTRLTVIQNTSYASCGNGSGTVRERIGNGSGTVRESTVRRIESKTGRMEEDYYQLQTDPRGEGDFQSPIPSPPLKKRKPVPQKSLLPEEPVEPALKTWIYRFAAYVLEATGHPLENMQRQTAAAAALIRNRGHTVEELNKILDYILSTKDDRGFRWYGNVLSIINLNAKTSKGDLWKSHCILAQSSTKRAYSRENPPPGSYEETLQKMNQAMEGKDLPY